MNKRQRNKRQAASIDLRETCFTYTDGATFWLSRRGREIGLTYARYKARIAAKPREFVVTSQAELNATLLRIRHEHRPRIVTISAGTTFGAALVGPMDPQDPRPWKWEPSNAAT